MRRISGLGLLVAEGREDAIDPGAKTEELIDLRALDPGAGDKHVADEGEFAKRDRVRDHAPIMSGPGT